MAKGKDRKSAASSKSATQQQAPAARRKSTTPVARRTRGGGAKQNAVTAAASSSSDDDDDVSFDDEKADDDSDDKNSDDEDVDEEDVDANEDDDSDDDDDDDDDDEEDDGEESKEANASSSSDDSSEGDTAPATTTTTRKRKAPSSSSSSSTSSSLSTTEVAADRVELLALLHTFRTKVREVREHVAPLLAKLTSNELPTAEGISFLQLKAHTLLQYCTSLAFVMLLKVEGRELAQHGVVQQLVQLRCVVEKVRPIDRKLKYQIDKLLKTAAGDTRRQRATAPTPAAAASGDAGDDNDDVIDVGGMQDPLLFRPNPAALIGKDGGFAAAKADRGGSNNPRGAGASALYRAPKLQAVPFDTDEKGGARARREEERAISRASNSTLVKSLRDDLFSDRPDQLQTGGGAASTKPDKQELERQQFEEDNMIRLMETKEYKKQRAKRQRINPNEDISFGGGDMRALMDMAGGSSNMSGGRRNRSLLEKVFKQDLGHRAKPGGGGGGGGKQKKSGKGKGGKKGGRR
jgi:hypothetical protein